MAGTSSEQSAAYVTGPESQPTPVAAPAVWMDQRGNYWRVFPKGTLAGADEDMLSMCPTSGQNYASEPVAIYRQGRDLSAEQAHDMLALIEHGTDDDLLLRTARSALQAWITGRDMVTEAEILLQMVAVRLGVPVDTRETIKGSRCANTPTPIRPPVKEANGHG